MSLILSSVCPADVTTLEQYGYLTRLKQRGSVIRAAHRQTVFKSLGEVSREPRFPTTVSVGQKCLESTQVQETQQANSQNFRFALSVQFVACHCIFCTDVQFLQRRPKHCRNHTSSSKKIRLRHDNAVIGPALDVKVTLPYGRYCIEILIISVQIENTFSWIVTRRGLDT